jgi:hypothetical protein
LRIALDAVDDLGAAEREQIAANLASHQKMLAEEQDWALRLLLAGRGWEAVLWEISSTVDGAGGECAQSRPRGRPKGAKGDPVFQGIVANLLHIVRAAGGRLTLNRKTSNGTLIDSIELLRGCLPPGTIPRELPLGTIESIKNRLSPKK